ncbi:hypothetical protein FCI23_00925 [Actinacidiphila oryziradicis]|uniref:Uncharacterized protein n=1 Tax=Actinacidiphila oryziradicis TaxID=2571141 RepID=A0A4U0STG0_9ACTN|nr:hypothetical protein FCI23_00925 [Actinacidiphila oryziradicis]
MPDGGLGWGELREWRGFRTGEGPAGPGGAAPLPHHRLAGRPLVGGRPAAYVCRHFVCDGPTAEAKVLAESLVVAVGRPVRHPRAALSCRGPDPPTA